MASISWFLSLPLFFSVLLFVNPALSADSPSLPPSLPPQPPATPSSAPPPAPAASLSPPPTPPPSSDLAPNSPPPAPTPPEHDKKSPSPAPPADGDISHTNQPNAGDLEAAEKSSGGMSSGQKAGVAIGVIAGACIVGAGAVVYKKRQQNIQRSQYGYAARREIL